MNVNSVCVFCGARTPQNPNFIEVAKECGKRIGQANLRLVYGGASVGLMGVVSKAAYEAGAHVLGVYPKFLHDNEPLSGSVSEARIVDSMSERKDIMLAESDAFIILPGGVGTLDEIFEVITLKSLGVLSKPIIFVNTDGYWNSLNTMMADIVEAQFASPGIFDTYHFVSSVEELFARLGVKS